MGSVRVSVRSPEPPKVSFIVMGTGTAAKSGDGYVYTNRNPLADGGILELPHGQAQSVFLRTMINSDADMKELDITKESGATGDAEAVDVTEVFLGLEDNNQIVRIDANRVGDTKFTISAMDGSDSERRRRGRSKQDVCDCNAKSLLPLNKKKALTLRKCLLPFNQL